GLKGKILNGWCAGTPCMATSIAAEGMNGSEPFGGIIEDDWTRYAEQAALLYGNRAMWHSAQTNGFRILSVRYAKERVIQIFLEDLDKVINSRDARRQKNFVGAMLWHHQHRSTEFFSRWIEAKERLSAEINPPANLWNVSNLV